MTIKCPLSYINLSRAEDLVQNLSKDALEKNSEFLKVIAIPLSKYMASKLESFQLQKYGKHNDLNWLFAEFVFFCPYDTNTPWKLLCFSIAFSMSKIDQDKVKRFFVEYHALTEVLQSEGRTVVFSPDFRETERWDKNFPITFFSDIIPTEEINLKEKYTEALKKDSRVYKPFSLQDTPEHPTYFLAITGDRLAIKPDAFDQTEKVSETHDTFHNLLHHQLDTKNETFCASVPVYVKNPQSSNYIIAGTFWLFGELHQVEMSNEEKKSALKIYRDISIEIRQEMGPVVAGYAYHRSRSKQYEETWADITHEIKGLPVLIDKAMPTEVLRMVQSWIRNLIMYNDSSNLSGSLDLKELAGHPLCDLIDHCLFNSLIFDLARLQVIEPCMGEDAIMEQIKERNEEFKKVCDVVYNPDKLQSHKVQDSDNIRLVSVMFTAAMKNVLEKVCQENPKIMVHISKHRIRITNNFIPTKNINPYGWTRRLLERWINKFEGKVNMKHEIIFGPVERDKLTKDERSFWTTASGTYSTSQIDLWLTEFPVILDVEGSK